MTQTGLPHQRGSPVLFCAVDFFRKVVYHKQVTYAGMVELADTLDLGDVTSVKVFDYGFQ